MRLRQHARSEGDDNELHKILYRAVLYMRSMPIRKLSGTQVAREAAEKPAREIMSSEDSRIGMEKLHGGPG
ncbi:hypothetical protein BC826DRAFT_1023300, partial [Russula brevipes]